MPTPCSNVRLTNELIQIAQMWTCQLSDRQMQRHLKWETQSSSYFLQMYQSSGQVKVLTVYSANGQRWKYNSSTLAVRRKSGRGAEMARGKLGSERPDYKKKRARIELESDPRENGIRVKLWEREIRATVSRWTKNSRTKSGRDSGICCGSEASMSQWPAQNSHRLLMNSASYFSGYSNGFRCTHQWCQTHGLRAGTGPSWGGRGGVQI